VRGVESGSATRSPSFSADCPGIVVGEVEEREAGEAEGVEISCGRTAAATDVEQWPADKTLAANGGGGGGGGGQRGVRLGRAGYLSGWGER